MMNLDHLNNLDTPPQEMLGFLEFIKTCHDKNIEEINMTGSNTDPSLYRHALLMKELCSSEGFKLGIRTNGVSSAFIANQTWKLYDRISISLPSLNTEIYRKMMGVGEPPNIMQFLESDIPIKINIVLGSPLLQINSEFCQIDLLVTIMKLKSFGVRTINLREPYGQPRIFETVRDILISQFGESVLFTHGMPSWEIDGMKLTLWDVHYVEVESVNLYANGRVSLDYAVTKGCSEHGIVKDQSNFLHEGRVRQQW